MSRAAEADPATAPDDHVRRTVEAVWRMESAKVTATLARFVRDVGLAEELAQDALVAALEQWRTDGVPRNPGAWLTTIGKRRAVDHIRRQETLSRKVAEIGRDLEVRGAGEGYEEDFDAALDDAAIEDDVLRLVFTACHPVLSTEARVALTLRMIGGLSTPEIARAFLVSEATAAQRIVRAKKALAEAQPPFETPEGQERAKRLGDVLEVIYLIYNEGYAATAGEAWMRTDLCDEALRLGRVLAGLVPDEPEVFGLVALMEIQSSRSRARVGPDGAPVVLLDQDRAKWDWLQIERGLTALARGEALVRRAAAARRAEDETAAGDAPGGSDTPAGVQDAGPYLLQAELAACHARARAAEGTDWFRIAKLYELLVLRTNSPVAELNRAVAVGMALGPAEGLAVADALVDHKALRNYHLLPSVRADLLRRLGRLGEAHAEFTRAAELTNNEQERALLLERAAECARADAEPGP